MSSAPWPGVPGPRRSSHPPMRSNHSRRSAKLLPLPTFQGAARARELAPRRCSCARRPRRPCRRTRAAAGRGRRPAPGRVGGERSLQRLDPAGIGHAVVVEHRDHRHRSACRKAAFWPPARPFEPPSTHRTGSSGRSAPSHHGPGVGARALVGDDDLRGRRAAVPQRLQAAGERLRPVAGGDRDADLGASRRGQAACPCRPVRAQDEARRHHDRGLGEHARRAGPSVPPRAPAPTSPRCRPRRSILRARRRHVVAVSRSAMLRDLVGAPRAGGGSRLISITRRRSRTFSPVRSMRRLSDSECTPIERERLRVVGDRAAIGGDPRPTSPSPPRTPAGAGRTRRAARTPPAAPPCRASAGAARRRSVSSQPVDDAGRALLERRDARPGRPPRRSRCSGRRRRRPRRSPSREAEPIAA